jgi:hypothetical protein
VSVISETEINLRWPLRWGRFTAVASSAVLLLVWLILRDMTATSLAAVILCVILLTGVQIMTLRRRTRIAIPASAVIVTAINMVGLFGYLFYRDLAADAQVSATLPESDSVYHAAAEVFLLASVGAWCGGLFAGGSRQRSDAAATIQEVLRSISPGGSVIAGMIPLVATILGFSPAGLIHRPSYLAALGIGICVSIGSLTTPIGLAVLSFTAFDLRRPFTVRATAIFLLLIHVVVLFAVGTRQIALIPGILLLGWGQTQLKAGQRTPRSMLLAVAVFTLLLVQLPLNLRGNPAGAGLAPFTATVVDNPKVLFSLHPGAVFGNILFSFPLAGTIEELRGGTLPIHGFITSISPLPGRYTDWATVFPTLGLNAATPFSGLGELAAHGRLFVLGYMFTVALALGLLQRSIHRLLPSAATISSLAILGVTVVFTFDVLQYNLRSGLRPVWYAILIVSAMHALARETRRASESGS